MMRKGSGWRTVIRIVNQELAGSGLQIILLPFLLRSNCNNFPIR